MNYFSLQICVLCLYNSNVKSLWRPEYGAYMIEGTPGKPYGGLLAHFNIVEANMRYRREEAQQLLGPDEVLMTITNFPRYAKLQYTDDYCYFCLSPPHLCVIDP
ncbi:glutamate--cysteine ligase catalytic subunit isoform X1 [Aphis craccivora]|uniref:Glutamate--cysteine ligase n=1 Tax=Aphis craccivora TaxID=307492 RepID=A0A6G0Z1G4_APHCR|nr:glutamate--cysteine ligase catalytic subunit isoform X1 [Aphis craccivora]